MKHRQREFLTLRHYSQFRAPNCREGILQGAQSVYSGALNNVALVRCQGNFENFLKSRDPNPLRKSRGKRMILWSRIQNWFGVAWAVSVATSLSGPTSYAALCCPAWPWVRPRPVSAASVTWCVFSPSGMIGRNPKTILMNSTTTKRRTVCGCVFSLKSLLISKH